MHCGFLMFWRLKFQETRSLKMLCFPFKRKLLQDYETIALLQKLFDGMMSSKSKAKRRGLKILHDGLVMVKVESRSRFALT